ncbi:MAG: hypothetical protein ACRDFW_01755 [bacterium]
MRAMLAMFSVALAAVLVAGGASPPVGAATTTALSADVISKVALARVATTKYVTNLELAKADGYQMITPMIPNMGYHFLNPKIQGFDVTRPPILVYVRRGEGWQLVAVEWVFPKKPGAAPVQPEVSPRTGGASLAVDPRTGQPLTPQVVAPLRGARYGSFGAACHYDDGSFVMADTEAQCATSNPKSGAAFGFWHPPFVTLHLWLWYPNPDGVFGEFNPYLSPFNND